MADVYYIGDLHLGHRGILEFSRTFRAGSNVDEHDEWIIEQWNSVVKKRDSVYLLGDAVWNREKLPLLGKLKGQIKLILGNHDKFHASEYLEYVRDLGGMVKRRGLWLTHCPMYEGELRGCKNVHGHVHGNTIWHEFFGKYQPDPRYVNVSVETCAGRPVNHDSIISGEHDGRPMVVE